MWRGVSFPLREFWRARGRGIQGSEGEGFKFAGAYQPCRSLSSLVKKTFGYNLTHFPASDVKSRPIVLSSALGGPFVQVTAAEAVEEATGLRLDNDGVSVATAPIFRQCFLSDDDGGARRGGGEVRSRYSTAFGGGDGSGGSSKGGGGGSGGNGGWVDEGEKPRWYRSGTRRPMKASRGKGGGGRFGGRRTWGGGNSKGSRGDEDMQPMVQKGLQAPKRGILRASEGSDSAFGSFVEATEGRRPAGEGAKPGAAYLPAEDPRYPGLRLNPYRNHSFFQRSPTPDAAPGGQAPVLRGGSGGGHPDDGVAVPVEPRMGHLVEGQRSKRGRRGGIPHAPPTAVEATLTAHGLPPMELPRWSQGSQWASLVS